MSNFSREDLYKIYDSHLSNFAELAQYAQESNVCLTLDLGSDGTITLSSSDWFTDKGKKVLRKHEIVQGKDRIEESSKTFLYDN